MRPARLAATIRNGLAAVDEWEAEYGAFTETELETARRRLAFINRRRSALRRRRVVEARRNRLS
jgi:hypothetical protein